MSASTPSTTPAFSSTLTQAIQIADQITRRCSASMQWSTWHTWNYFHKNPDTAHSTTIWDETYPFATCVGFCTTVAQCLKTTYETTPSLAHFARQVQILTSWEISPYEPELGERPRHSVVALLLPEACILVDLVFSPIVMVIPSGGMFETIPYITMSGRRGKRVFFYESMKLKMANPKRETVVKDLFRPMSPEEALNSIVKPNAFRTMPGVPVPVAKVMIIRGMVRERPKKVPGVQLDVGAWMITTCRLQIDFWNRRLTMQIPLEDWLLKERNEWRSRISHPIFHPADDTIINLVLDLHPDCCGVGFDESLKIFERIGSCLGLPVAELDKIIASVHEAWSVELRTKWSLAETEGGTQT